MNATWIITVFVVVDDLMQELGHRTHKLAHASDAEVLLVAIVAAQFFQNHHERALAVMHETHYLSGTLSVSRFNRRVHALADWLPFLAEVLGELSAQGEVFVIDSLPIPVCKRFRARRCRKVRGAIYCGYCAAKKAKFFGWRLHLICTPAGEPVRFSLVPAALHDLTPIHELTYGLPAGARVFGDKAYVSAPCANFILAEGAVRLIAQPRDNMQPLEWADEYDLRLYRHTIETVNSQCEKMGMERLYARTDPGFLLKVHASLVALTCNNLN